MKNNSNGKLEFAYSFNMISFFVMIFTLIILDGMAAGLFIPFVALLGTLAVASVGGYVIFKLVSM